MDMGVGEPAHIVTKPSVVVVAVQPNNTVFSSPGSGPLVLVKIYWPLEGGGVDEGPPHDEPDQVCVGSVLYAHMSAPVVFMVAYCPVTLPLEQSQYVSAEHTTGPPSPPSGSWLQVKLACHIYQILREKSYWILQIGTDAEVTDGKVELTRFIMAPDFATVEVGTEGLVDGEPDVGDVEISLAVMLPERYASVFEAASIVENERSELDDRSEIVVFEDDGVFAAERDVASDPVGAEALPSRERRLWIMDKSDPENEIAISPASEAVLYVNEPENKSRSWPSNELIGHASAEELVADVVIIEDEVLADLVLADVMLTTPDAEAKAVPSRDTRL